MARRPATRRNARSPFAHLNGARMADDENDTTPPNADTDEPDNLPPEEGEDDGDQKREARRLKGEDPDPDDGENAQSDDDMDAEDERDDEDDRKAEDEDSDDDGAIREDAKARASSRARAILRRPEAANNLALACHIAFSTNMTRMQAVAALRAASTGSRRSRRRNARQTGGHTTASLRSRMGASSIRPVQADARAPKSSLQNRVAGFNKRHQ